MRKKFVVLIVSAAALAMNTTAIAQNAGGEHYHEHEQEKKKKQKYTCPMHPEVVIDHPGNCPKCGMKLVPVAEKKRSTPNLTSQGYGAADLQRPTSHSRHATADANSMAMPHHEHGGHEMHMEMHSSIDIADPMSREGSGTSWLPDSSPMYGRMFMFDENTLMLHGAIFPRYTNVSTRRGDDRIDAPNWFMAMFSHPFGSNAQLGARLMMSLDPLTEGGRGYPLLFQSGESWNDQPLHDRQHPHDLFDELSVSLSQKFDSYSGRMSWNPTRNLALQVSYGYIHSPEALEPELNRHRTTASLIYNLPLGPDSNWSNTFVWGQNHDTGEGKTQSSLVESNYQRGRNTIYLRWERVEKSGHELVLKPPDESHIFPVSGYTIGYVRDVSHGNGLDIGLGTQFTINDRPDRLDRYYGDD